MTSFINVKYLLLLHIFTHFTYSSSIPLSVIYLGSDDKLIAVNIISNKTVLYDVNMREYITQEQRKLRCKEVHPGFDYESLNEEDKNQLSDNSVFNPCRIDCVLYEELEYNRRRKVIYTVYFTDGKTQCYENKVCKARNNVGVCDYIDWHH